MFPFTFWLAGVNAFHDGSHFALSTSAFTNNFFVYSNYILCDAQMWMHQHIVGHHIYPNIAGRDPDLYHAPKYVRHDNNLRLRPVHKYQFPFGFVWVSTVATWIGLALLSA